MARKTLEPNEKRVSRVNVSMTEETRENLSILAKIDNTNSAALAGKVLDDYIAAREAEIAEFRQSVEQIRAKYAHN